MLLSPAQSTVKVDELPRKGLHCLCVGLYPLRFFFVLIYKFTYFAYLYKLEYRSTLM